MAGLALAHPKLKLNQLELEPTQFSIDISQDEIDTESFGGGPFTIPGPTTWSCSFSLMMSSSRLQTIMALFSSWDSVVFEAEVGRGRKFSGQVLIDDFMVDSSGRIECQLTGIGALNLMVGGENVEIGQPIRIDEGVYGAVHKQATELLLMFLDKEQAKQFKESGAFAYLDDQGRHWRFYRRFHYPVDVREVAPPAEDWPQAPEQWPVPSGKPAQKLCFETGSDMPIEDLLLLAFLEVKGGRGNELIKVGTGARAEVNNGS